MQPEIDLGLRGFPPIFNRPLAFVDVESTGLPRRDADGYEKYGNIDIIDVAVIRDGVPWESKVRLSPYDEQRADNDSRNSRKSWRDVTGYTTREWADAPEPSAVLPDLARQLHGATIVAHNSAYDLQLLASWLERHGVAFGAVFSWSVIDTYQLAKSQLGRRGLTKFSLDACCEFLKLEREGYHRAMGGAKRCRQLYHELCKLAWRP